MCFFGIVYGISEYGLGMQLGIPQKKAKQYIEQYIEKYAFCVGKIDHKAAPLLFILRQTNEALL